MSERDIITNMSRGWNRQPAAAVVGTEPTGMSAAVWSHEKAETIEVWGAPAASNVLSLQMRTVRADIGHEGRNAIRGRICQNAINLTRAGERTTSVIYGSARVLQFYLPQELFRLLAEQTSFGFENLELLDPGCSYDPVVEHIGSEVIREMQGGQLLSRLRVDSLGQELAIQLLRRWSNLAGTRAPKRTLAAKGGLAAWQERRTTEFLRHHAAEDVTLDELAAVAQLSTFHFARAFKQSTGMPPHAYLRRLRCEKARDLLTRTKLPITEIAAQVGYDTPQAFARMFRAEVGASPSEYRRERSW